MMRSRPCRACRETTAPCAQGLQSRASADRAASRCKAARRANQRASEEGLAAHLMHPCARTAGMAGTRRHPMTAAVPSRLEPLTQAAGFPPAVWTVRTVRRDRVAAAVVAQRLAAAAQAEAELVAAVGGRAAARAEAAARAS